MFSSEYTSAFSTTSSYEAAPRPSFPDPHLSWTLKRTRSSSFSSLSLKMMPASDDVSAYKSFFGFRHSRLSLSKRKRSMALSECIPSAVWNANPDDVTYVKILPNLFLPASLGLSPSDGLVQQTNSDVTSDSVHPLNVTIASSTIDVMSFGAIFRHCAPYIASHRGGTMVFHLPAHYLYGSGGKRALFENMMDEIAILHLLGIHIVLVIGVRETVDQRLRSLGKTAMYHQGIRVTDLDTLALIKEESGKARFEVESLLARGFKGITNSKQVGINMVSSNLFYSAKPFGIRDGVDYQFTGEVRRVDSDNIRKRLESQDIICLTSLGYSMSGEVFHIPSETLAAECAIALQASKIVFVTQGEGMIDVAKKSPIQSLRLSQAKVLLNQWNIHASAYNYFEKETATTTSETSSEGEASRANTVQRKVFQNVSDDMQHFLPKYVDATHEAFAHTPASPLPTTQPDTASKSAPSQHINSFVRMIARSVYALTGGVKRAHLLPPTPGALISELFTRDGAGLLISRDTYEGVRPAQDQDLRSILEIIRPLESDGILIHRTPEQILQDLSNYYVMTRDGGVVAVGKLTQYSPTQGEISCLAVHPQYRKSGRGEIMLSYLERRAMTMGLQSVFVLSTRTMQWFEERGFALAPPSVLPENRAYDKSRASRVYVKPLVSSRDIDAEELFWDIN